MTNVLIREDSVIYEQEFLTLVDKTAEFFKDEIEAMLLNALKENYIDKKTYIKLSQDKASLILSSYRFRKAAETRMFICYYIYLKNRRVNLETLGKWLGDRNHSSIIYYRDKLRGLLSFDKKHNKDFYLSKFKQYIDFLMV